MQLIHDAAGGFATQTPHSLVKQRWDEAEFHNFPIFSSQFEDLEAIQLLEQRDREALPMLSPGVSPRQHLSESCASVQLNQQSCREQF